MLLTGPNVGQVKFCKVSTVRLQEVDRGRRLLEQPRGEEEVSWS